MSVQRVNTSLKTFKFNPGFQSDDESVQNFIVRQSELERVIGAFGGTNPPTIPRVLVIAPRGAGKTTLCRRFLAEVPRSPMLREQWHPIYLGEESYAITTPGEFFLECLFHLNERSPDAGLQRDYEEAAQISDEDELLNSVLGLFRKFSERSHRRLLIIVENFQIILSDQIGTGTDELLAVLRDETLFGVLATSVAQWEAESARESPTGFLEIRLEPLTLAECHALWEALTDHDVKADRIRPLQILTGGSPRLLHILAEFMRTPSLRNLMDNLNLLIDQNTEYFKSQLDALPSIERKVFAALLDAWDPCTAKVVAETARVNTNISSAMLARLTSRGIVIKEQGRGRTAIYYAAERLFNIYYLMRRRSQPASRVHALVSFMTEYYDRDELIDTAAIIAKEACKFGPDNRADYHSTFHAILSKVPKSVRVGILERTPPEFIDSFEQHQKALHGRSVVTAASTAKGANAEPNSSVRSIVRKAQQALDRDDVDEARRLLVPASKAHPNSASVWTRLALVHYRIEDFDSLLVAAERLQQMGGDGSLGLAFKGIALAGLGKVDEAKAAFSRVLELEPDNPIALVELAEVLEDQGDLSRASEIYERLGELELLDDSLTARYGRILSEQGEVQKAEDVLRAQVKDPASYRSRRALVELLCELGRESEGTKILRNAAKLADDWRSWADFGTYLLSREEDAPAAKKALKRAIKLGGDVPRIYYSLASAAIRSGDPKESVVGIADDLVARLSTDPDAWIAAGSILGMAGLMQRAESSLRTAIEKDGGAPAWTTLGRFLDAQGDRTSEAAEAFRAAIAASEGSHVCGPSRELAELLIHAGEDDTALTVLKQALQQNSRCYCCTVAQAEIAGRRGDKTGACSWYRAALNIRNEGIRALTGLSRFVDHDEARALIDAAIAAKPYDPLCLLARAQIQEDDTEARVNDAFLALEHRPSFVEAHIFLMPILARRGEVDRAIASLKDALDALSKRRELIPSFVEAVMATAAAGASEKVSKVIEAHEYGSSIEPLVVALKLKRGEKPMVAKEIMAVAEDIANAAQKPHPST